MSDGLATHVRRAAERAFDAFAATMDRYVLEDYTTNSAISAELNRQGLLDFADFWETYIGEAA